MQQVRELLKATRGHQLHALIMVFALLGLRRSDALGLRWDDVDLHAGVLRVRRSLHRVEGKLAVFDTKTPTLRPRCAAARAGYPDAP